MKKIICDSLKQAAARVDGLAEMTDGLRLRLEGVEKEIGLVIKALETEALAEEALEGGAPEPPPQGKPKEKHDICIWEDEEPVYAGANGKLELDFYEEEK